MWHDAPCCACVLCFTQTGELVWTTGTLTDKVGIGTDGGSDDSGAEPTLGHLRKITAACVCSAAGSTVVGYSCGWLLCMKTKVGCAWYSLYRVCGACACSSMRHP